ncbi:MAG: hypothetical protein SH850_19290 [Planctomycetaceae bacterium]|nr:hypothetical protein [Planctomycetaceae bacterium]
MNAGVAGADGFGEASPVCGLLPPGSKLGMHFGWIDKFPERTTLRWWDNDAMQEYSQDIDLTNIVHPGVNGTYVFTLSADNKWTVRFDRLEKSR